MRCRPPGSSGGGGRGLEGRKKKSIWRSYFFSRETLLKSGLFTKSEEARVPCPTNTQHVEKFCSTTWAKHVHSIEHILCGPASPSKRRHDMFSSTCCILVGQDDPEKLTSREVLAKSRSPYVCNNLTFTKSRLYCNLGGLHAQAGLPDSPRKKVR